MAAKIIPDSVRDFISYDPHTGNFHWIKKPNRRIKVGQKAGRILKDGRGKECVQIGYQGTKYYAHRVALFLMTGEQPDEVDHIDRNPMNNRINNLRDVDHPTNMGNLSATGVRWAWINTKSKGRIYRYLVVIAQYRCRRLYHGKSILLAWYARIMAEREDHPLALPMLD